MRVIKVMQAAQQSGKVLNTLDSDNIKYAIGLLIKIAVT